MYSDSLEDILMTKYQMLLEWYSGDLFEFVDLKVEFLILPKN